MSKTEKMTAAKKIASKESAKEMYERNIARALELQDQIKFAESELKKIKLAFIDILSVPESTQIITTSAGSVKLKVTNSYSVDAALVPDLKKIFKVNYSDFVNEKVSYGVQAKLKNLLSDGDYKHKDIVRSAVRIAETKSVVFEEPKINKPKLVK